MPGYSGTPLWKKLGIKPQVRLVLLKAPPGFSISDLPSGVTTSTRGLGDITLRFVRSSRELSCLQCLRNEMADAAALWICWPKKSSGVVTDVTEDVIRSAALAAGLVDIKVCAVDDTWSGLKLMIPVKDRRTKP